MFDPLDTLRMWSGGNGRWPTSAAELAAAMGYGTWASAWLCDEASGSLADSIGSQTLAAEGTPRYRDVGALPGDLAIGLDDNTGDKFLTAGTAAYDLDASTSLALYACFAFDGTPSNRYFLSKIAFGDGYGLGAAGGGGSLFGYVDGAVSSATANLVADHRGGAFRDVLMCIDRTGQVLQVFSDLGASAEVSIAAVTTLTNAVKFGIGTVGGNSPGVRLAYAAVATGGIDTLRASATTAIANIRRFTGRA